MFSTPCLYKHCVTSHVLRLGKHRCVLTGHSCPRHLDTWSNFGFLDDLSCTHTVQMTNILCPCGTCRGGQNDYVCNSWAKLAHCGPHLVNVNQSINYPSCATRMADAFRHVTDSTKSPRKHRAQTQRGLRLCFSSACTLAPPWASATQLGRSALAGSRVATPPPWHLDDRCGSSGL